MALTRDFKDTVRARAQTDPKFRLALIEEAIESLIEGDLDGGRSILSNYINATIGYSALAELTGKDAKSLIRMLRPGSNPTSRNLLSILNHLTEQEGVEIEVRVKHA
jgi:DNA-binding phage protein